MSALFPDLSITGVAFWAPGYDDARALGEADPAIKAPKAELLPARLRRRCSLLTRMSAEVVARASAQAGIDPSAATVILASVYGEILTTGQLLSMMSDDPGSPLSPTRFHNSVHNTPIGYLSIATKNHTGSTAISAGASTVAMAMLEAATTVAAGEGPAVIVLVEESLPAGLALSGGTYDGLAVALIVESRRDAGIPVRMTQEGTPEPLASLPESFAANPLACAVSVAAALLGDGATIPLEPSNERSQAWLLEVEGRGGSSR